MLGQGLHQVKPATKGTVLPFLQVHLETTFPPDLLVVSLEVLCLSSSVVPPLLCLIVGQPRGNSWGVSQWATTFSAVCSSVLAQFPTCALLFEAALYEGVLMPRGSCLGLVVLHWAFGRLLPMFMLLQLLVG